METISFTTFVDQLKERFAMEVITENIGKHFSDLPFGDIYKGVSNEFLIDSFNEDIDIYVNVLGELNISDEKKVKILLDFHYNVYSAVDRVVSTYFFYFGCGYTTYTFLDHIENRIKDLNDFVEYDNPSCRTLTYLEGLFETLKGLPMKK